MHLIELINNVTLLLALSMIYILLIRKIGSGTRVCNALLGTLFGLFTIFGMLNPVNFLPGIFFDGRSILLSAGAFIGGPITAAISTIIASMFRLYIGGQGKWVGVIVIISASVIGILANHYHAKKAKQMTGFELYIFGLIVHVVMIACMLILPEKASENVLQNIALPILAIFPFATLVLTAALIELKKTLLVEKELQESHEFYSNIIDNCKTLIYATDLDGKFILANAELLKILGKQRDEVLGCPRKLFMSSEQVQEQLINDKKVLKSKSSVLVEEKLFYGGKVNSYICVKFPLKYKDSEISAIGSISTDVSEWKEAQEELDKTRKLFATAFDYAPIGMAIVKLDGSIHKVNDVFCKILGFTEDEIVGSNFRTFTHPDDLSISDENIKKMLTGEVGRFSLEKRYISKFGKVVYSHTHASVLRNDVGEPQYFFTQLVDITQRKQLQDRLYQSQKLESLGNLAGGIAHDFNNILASIIGFSELVKQDLNKGHPAYSNIEAVLKSSSRAKDLVKRILLFARKTEEEKQPIDLGKQIKETLALLRPTIPSSIALDCAMEEGATIYSNPSHVNQIIINLITNASQSIGTNVGRISVNLSRTTRQEIGTLEHLGAGTDKFLRLVIEDTGQGIDEATIGRIFEPYYSTKSPDSGTGLGLSVVHGLVTEAMGKILVESKLGEGASFILYFPEYVCESQKALPEHNPALGGTEHILLVDDEDMIITSFSMILQSFGYKVTAFHDPEEAMEAFAKEPDSYDIVISDMTMPNMTGDVLAQEMLKIKPDLPIIICTGFSRKLSEEGAKELGIKKLIFKPITGVNLSVAVRNVLDQSRQS